MEALAALLVSADRPSAALLVSLAVGYRFRLDCHLRMVVDSLSAIHTVSWSRSRGIFHIPALLGFTADGLLDLGKRSPLDSGPRTSVALCGEFSGRVAADGSSSITSLYVEGQGRASWRNSADTEELHASSETEMDVSGACHYAVRGRPPVAKVRSA